MVGESTIMVILNCYLITFLQRMMELRGHLDLAQRSLSRLFNSRRINASIAPVFIGLLPSPGAIFIAGSMVDTACGDYISKEDKTFVASYFRHIPESFLPTYSSIILACQLTGVQMGAFVLGMVPMVACLMLLGYLFYLRRVPKETGEAASTDKLADLQSLMPQPVDNCGYHFFDRCIQRSGIYCYSGSYCCLFLYQPVYLAGD